MSIITVDFDGTLYHGNSIIPMFKNGRKEMTFKQWCLIIRNFSKMALIKKHRKEKDLRIAFLRAFFSQMEGKNKEELDAFFKIVIEGGQDGINNDMVSRINKHLENGDSVIVVSGSLQPFLEVFIEHLNIKADALGTPLIFDKDGVCTGQVGRINRGIDKVDKVKQWIKENNRSGERIWAYADSQSDLPLLEFADKSVVVNPSKTMKEIAQSKGWEVLDT